MLIHLISVGNRMPEWVRLGFDNYAKRMPRECQIILTEVAPVKGTKKNDKLVEIKLEGQRIVEAIPKNAHVIALDQRGAEWTSRELSVALDDWLSLGSDVALLIGGPEGLSDACLSRAKKQWSLSGLTFPHPLVRIIVAEQLYRAWAILQNHPYHR